MLTESVSNPTPRVCVLRKEEGETFGFNLRVERGRQGHIIRQLESLGVAVRSGLRDGDRLLEVNEMFVDNVEHMEVRGYDLYFAIIVFFLTVHAMNIWFLCQALKQTTLLSLTPSQVARRIQVSGSQFCFLVLDEKGYDQAVSEGLDLRELAKASRGEGWRPPRLCHIKKEAPGLGLNILLVEGKNHCILHLKSTCSEYDLSVMLFVTSFLKEERLKVKCIFSGLSVV